MVGTNAKYNKGIAGKTCLFFKEIFKINLNQYLFFKKKDLKKYLLDNL